MYTSKQHYRRCNACNSRYTTMHTPASISACMSTIFAIALCKHGHIAAKGCKSTSKNGHPQHILGQANVRLTLSKFIMLCGPARSPSIKTRDKNKCTNSTKTIARTRVRPGRDFCILKRYFLLKLLTDP